MKKHLRKIAILLTVCMCLPLFAACDINSLLGNQQPSVSTDVKDEKDDTEAPEIQDDELPEGLELKLGKDNNSYKVEKYKGDAEDIEIPASYNGFPVTEIGPRAFDNSKKLISVVIPDSVEIIADSAFKNCKNLEYVVIGEYESMLRKIDKQAFHGCEMLDLIEFVGYEDTWNDIEKAKDWDKNVGKKTDDKTYELVFIDPTEPPVETQPVETQHEYTEPEYTDIFGSETEEVSRPSDDTEEPSIDIPSDISLAFPALGTITTKHDPSLQVWFPTVGAYMVHLGIDIAAVTSNYDVYAAADGVVEKVWYDADYGWSVAINHGYATTYYKSLQIASNTVVAGDTVTSGQIIAQMGDSSSVEKNDGIHLHFELEISEELVDPIKHFLNIPTVEPEIPDDDETIWEPDVETETETWVDIEDETEFVCAHADYDYNEICDFCGEFIGHKCYDNDANYRCDFCDTMLEHVCVNDNNDLYCDLCGAEMTHACIDNDRDYKCDLCQAVCPPDADSTLTISEAIALGSLYDRSCHSTNKFFVTGTIVEIQNTTYGNLYIQDDEGNRLYIYGVYSEDGSVRFGNMDPMPKVGDIVTLYGIIGCYSEAQMKNVFVVRHDILDVPEAPEEPVEPEEHVHSYSSDYVWDEAKQKYVGSCVTCGKKLEQSMLYFSEPVLGSGSNSSVSVSQEDGFVRYTVIRDADIYFHIYTNGQAITGQYVVIKYRLVNNGKDATERATFVGSIQDSHNYAADMEDFNSFNYGPLIGDEEWHYAVIEAVGNHAIYNEDGTFSYKFIRIGFNPDAFDGSCYLDIDELAFADCQEAVDSYIGVVEDETETETETEAETEAETLPPEAEVVDIVTDKNGREYTWEAKDNGNLYITMISDNWKLTVNGTVYSSANGDSAKHVIRVSKGDTVTLNIATADGQEATVSFGLLFLIKYEGEQLEVYDYIGAVITRDENGNLVVTNTMQQSDVYLNVIKNSEGVVGRYIAVTYKTTNASMMGHMRGIAADGTSLSWKPYTFTNVIRDGEWHVAIIDVYEILGEGAKVTNLRFDVCESKSEQQTVSFKSIEMLVEG